MTFTNASVWHILSFPVIGFIGPSQMHCNYAVIGLIKRVVMRFAWTAITPEDHLIAIAILLAFLTLYSRPSLIQILCSSVRALIPHKVFSYYPSLSYSKCVSRAALQLRSLLSLSWYMLPLLYPVQIIRYIHTFRIFPDYRMHSDNYATSVIFVIRLFLFCSIFSWSSFWPQWDCLMTDNALF